MRYLIALVSILLFLSPSSFSVSASGGCPAGANDCFLCGGIDGIACSMNCTGVSKPGVGNVACECPQGKACTCYCPYGGGTSLTSSGQVSAPSTGAWISAMDGPVYIKSPGGEWALATQNVPLGRDYEVRTDKGSKATISVDDGSKIYVDEETEFGINELDKKAPKTTIGVVLELMKGALFSDVTKRDGTKFEIDTHVEVTGVKGTKFAVYYDDIAKQATIKAIEGSVEVQDTYGKSMSLASGSMVKVNERGMGNASTFEVSAEQGRWGSSGCCGSSSILLSVLLCAAAFAPYRNKAGPG